jgi:hypothetical protein
MPRPIPYSSLKPGYYRVVGHLGLEREVWIRPDRSGITVLDPIRAGSVGGVGEYANIDSLGILESAEPLPELYGVVHIKHAKITYRVGYAGGEYDISRKRR